MRPDAPRDPIAGPDSGPESPFPLKVSGKVIKGFGRGSAELGIPTANIPLSGLTIGGCPDLDSGIYFGWSGLHSPPSSTTSTSTSNPTPEIYPMVLSIGWNPYYKNSVRSIEVHILHSFPRDFYGAHLNLIILGFIRPEYDYVNKESLIQDIRTDIEVARKSLEREHWERWREDGYLKEVDWSKVDEVKGAEAEVKDHTGEVLGEGDVGK